MKALIRIGSLIFVIGVAAYCLVPGKPAPAKAPVVETFTGPRPTTTNEDPIDIFQRAFWRRPSPADQILHAERREWAEAGELKKWQWFIVVEPSPDLVKRLREENAFGLVSAKAMEKSENPPAWFSPPAAAEAEVFRSPTGNFQLVFSKAKPLLYATDYGGGFASGAPESAKEAPSPPVPSGRLPPNPPPNPRTR